jgi:hypothetical protein
LDPSTLLQYIGIDEFEKKLDGMLGDPQFQNKNILAIKVCRDSISKIRAGKDIHD